jgi:hypothetical protein
MLSISAGFSKLNPLLRLDKLIDVLIVSQDAYPFYDLSFIMTCDNHFFNNIN